MCLWAVDTQREMMRILVSQAANLSAMGRAKLESAILAGPPRTLYRADLESGRWQQIVDQSIWLRLAKLQAGSGKLGDAALQQHADLSVANPGWKLANNESDEFSNWMSGTGDPDFEASREITVAPRKRRELVEWLKQAPPQRFPFYEDTWRETCRTRFFTVCLLCVT